MKKYTFITVVILFLLFSCTKKESENPAPENSISAELMADTIMTIEKYAQMDLELVNILMKNYYDKFKDKEYEEVKELYEEFLKDKKQIYTKYGVKDSYKTALWARQNRKELKMNREDHPEINYYIIYPDFKEANEKLYDLSRSQYFANKAVEDSLKAVENEKPEN